LEAALEGRSPSLTSRVQRVGTGDPPEDCEWDYDNFPKWGNCSYTCGYTSNQPYGSPINIDTSIDMPSEKFNLSTPSGETLESSSYRNLWNSGELVGKWSREGFAFQLTIDDNLDDEKVPTIKYGTDSILTYSSETYKLRVVEYHWGKDATEGSEHTINDVQDPVEVHYVHENTDPVFTHTDDDFWKYLVIAVLYEKVDTEDDETNWIKRPAMFARKIAIDELKSSASDSEGNPLNDSSELITITKNFHGYLWKTLTTALKDGHYAYEGSLTVPGCIERVTWIVAKKKLKVYGPHLAYFRKLTFPRTGAQIKRNWRPRQELGDRTVFNVNAMDD